MFVGLALLTRLLEEVTAPLLQPLAAQIQKWTADNWVLAILLAGIYVLLFLRL
jgi:hypothetical protein